MYHPSDMRSFVLFLIIENILFAIQNYEMNNFIIQTERRFTKNNISSMEKKIFFMFFVVENMHDQNIPK